MHTKQKSKQTSTFSFLFLTKEHGALLKPLVYELCVQQNLIYSTLKVALRFENVWGHFFSFFLGQAHAAGRLLNEKGILSPLLYQQACDKKNWSHASFRLATINNDRRLQIKQIKVEYMKVLLRQKTKKEQKHK